jgi:hypothetical protein
MVGDSSHLLILAIVFYTAHASSYIGRKPNQSDSGDSYWGSRSGAARVAPMPLPANPGLRSLSGPEGRA